MRLNAQTDFGLRMLMDLSINSNRLRRIADIAELFGLSLNHAMKISQSLVHAGFVEGVRGRGGGLRLAMAPEDISVGAVVRALENDFALVECFSPQGHCPIARSCRLPALFDRALEAFLAELDRSSLADLIEGNTPLAESLTA